jgi:hypothetical protein
MMRLKRVVEGFTLVGFGLIFLGIATGMLTWSVWMSLLSLWPLLVIAIGFDIIGKAIDQPWVRVLSSLLVLGGLIFAVATTPTRTFSWSVGLWGPESVAFSHSEPADRRVDEGSARVKGAVGDLTIAGGEQLAEASGSSPFGPARFQVDKDGALADVEISMGEGGAVWGFRGEPRMDVELSSDVIWDLTLDSGVSTVEADLAEVPLSALAVKSGVSTVQIKLGDVPRSVREVPVRVEVGVSAATLRIPADADVRVTTKTGLANVVIPSGLDQVEDGVYETDRFGRARHRYSITVESGIADVRIERY